MSATDRRGFTLFSMLVLLALGGILMAMFFPAVLKVRAAAQATSCRNNLHMLGVALHDREIDYQRLPAAGMGEPEREKPETGSWCFALLPYLEQENLFKQGGGKVPVAVLYCSVRRPPKLYGDHPKTDYAGCVGTADDPEKPAKEDGVFTKKGARLAEILDGTSNTILFGEKGLRSTEYQSGNGAGDKGSCWTGGTIDTLRSSHGEKRPPLRDLADADHERGFGSGHDKVCNFTFCDGSVRAIRYAIKGSLFQALCTRAGGEAVNPAEF